MKICILVSSILCLLLFAGVSAVNAADNEKSREAGNAAEMSRSERAAVKLKNLISPQYPISSGPDAEYMTILENFIFGEVFYYGDKLTDRERIMILLVITTANQNPEQFRGIAGAAVRNKILTPADAKEAVYHCTPYIGFPKTLSALSVLNEIFKEQGIALPLESQSTVTEETRLEKGLALQKRIFGDMIEQSRTKTPENQQHIYDYISAMCFGDFYTRSGLDVKTREMLTFCILSALGDCESQLKGHIRGNFNIGNDADVLIEALTQSLPYIGLPRALNVLELINCATGETS
jgi:4-carboxymuconolactone decarboxylase